MPNQTNHTNDWQHTPAHLFDSLIWPAVAGNVAWALFTLVLQPAVWRWDWEWEHLARVLALSVFSIYLVIAWMRNRPSGSPLYFALDALFAIGIVVFAISTQNDDMVKTLCPEIALISVFAIAAIGHACKVWDNARNWLLLAFNAIGLVIVVIARYSCWPDPIVWHRTIAIAIVVFVWGCVVVCEWLKTGDRRT